MISGDIADSVLDLALALDRDAARYELRALSTASPRLAAWRPDARYARTGAHTEADARALVEQAAAITHALSAELWMDGRIRVER
jgi:hypothetical protein